MTGGQLLDFFWAALAVIAFAIIASVRLIATVILDRLRGSDYPRKALAELPPEERLLHALDYVDPCRLGVLGSQDVYPRVVSMLGPGLDRRADEDLQAALLADLRIVGGGGVSKGDVRKILRMVRG